MAVKSATRQKQGSQKSKATMTNEQRGTGSYTQQTKRTVVDSTVYRLEVAATLPDNPVQVARSWSRLDSEVRVGLARELLASLTAGERAELGPRHDAERQLQEHITGLNDIRRELSEALGGESLSIAESIARARVLRSSNDGTASSLREVVEAAVDCGWDADECDLPEWLRAWNYVLEDTNE